MYMPFNLNNNILIFFSFAYGLKDLSSVIGKDFKRLKIGVSHPGRKNEVTNWR